LNGAKYKDKKLYFEISVKLRVFLTPYQPIAKKSLAHYFVIFYFKKLISA
jgi:hypothetical protein